MNISKIEEQFKLLPIPNLGTDIQHIILSFYRANITSLLERTKLEKQDYPNSNHNNAHTLITDGYCYACKRKLTTDELITDFGYNQAVSDQEEKIKKALE